MKYVAISAVSALAGSVLTVAGLYRLIGDDLPRDIGWSLGEKISRRMESLAFGDNYTPSRQRYVTSFKKNETVR